MSIGQVRIRVPEKAKAGEVVTVRVLITHPMEVIRFEGGKPVVRNYNFIHRVEATYNGKPVFEAETTQAVSQNPLFVFPIRVDAPGVVRITFYDTEGKTYTVQAEIKFLPPRTGTTAVQGSRRDRAGCGLCTRTEPRGDIGMKLGLSKL